VGGDEKKQGGRLLRFLRDYFCRCTGIRSQGKGISICKEGREWRKIYLI